ncbi:SDR family oxidoreductase [Sunxiuqinia sp. A32]|uniref:SDR family oxidoreductase n=1 Tax=Sunxiuqinia sp. A32 TaxID=3461496 RepID=UPI004045E586
MNIFIVGATSGIGKSIAEKLQFEGHRIFGFGRRVDDEINDNGISWIKMDVCKTESVHSAVKKATSEAGRIDVLIQCAGKGAIGPIESYTPEDIEDVFNLNILGIHRVNREIIPLMRNQANGKIILISSLAAESGLPFNGVYSASKAVLDIFTESLRMEIRQFGIQACVLQPGDFKTEVAQHRKIPDIAPDSPYKDQFERINKTATDKVEFAGDPEKVAIKISQLLKKRKLKPKYRVGSTIELIMPKAKTILPASWFEKLLMKYYKL